MDNKNFDNLVKLAVDAYHGVPVKYSVAESMDTLREALIEMNGGSTQINYKSMRNHPEMFTLIETILQRTVVDGLQGDEFFMNMVDFRNIALGDKNEFVTEDDILYTVAEAADGTQGIRRQRLGGATKVSLDTTLKVVKIYEELNRILAGQADFNKMIANVGLSFRKQLLQDVYDLWFGASSAEFGGTYYFSVSGTFDDSKMMDLIGHVEAASGKQATIMGTKKALQNLKFAENSDGYKNDLYNMGYAGMYYGTPVVALPQRHQRNSTTFAIPDQYITVVASDEKPVKVVYEGQSLLIQGDPMNHGDLTQDYLYGEKYGCGLILAGANSGFGRYEIAT